MGLSAKDAAAVKKAAAAGGASSSAASKAISAAGGVTSSTPSISSSSSNKSSSSVSIPAPVAPTTTSTISTIKDPVTGQTFSRDTSIAGSTYAPVGGSSAPAPIASMGTVAKDPAKSVSAPSTTLPTSQTAPSNVASGVSIWGPSTVTPSGSTPFGASAPSASNANTASLLTSSLPKSSTSGTPSASTYSGGSLVDYLASTGKPTDYSSRAALAAQNGIANYSGTADQNTQLLNKLRGSSGGTSTYGSTTPVATTPTPTTAQVVTPTPLTTTGVPVTGTPAATAPVPSTGLYGQLINDQAQRSQSSKEYQRALDNYQKSVDNYNKLKQTIDDQMANIDLDPGSLYFQTGRKGVLQQLGAQKLADAAASVTQAQQALQSATAQYSAQTQALQGAIGAAGTVLQGGQYMPFGGDNVNFQSGLDRQRMVDTYNYNTQQGLDFSGQASQLDQPIQALSLLGPQLANYLSANGLNTNTAVMANSLINSGLSQTNPAAYAVIKSAGTEAQVLISQIAGFNSSLIPSDITQKANAMSIDNMSPQDIITFINATNAIAQPRYASLKASASGALNNSFQPYTGSTSANPYASIPNTPTPSTSIGNAPNTNNSWANAGIGAALQFGSYVVPAISSIAGWFSGGGLLRAGAALFGK